MSKCLGMLALVMLFSGCAQTIPAYVPPQTGPVARLLMRGTLGPGMLYSVVDYEGAEDCTRPRRLGMGLANSNPEAVTISANRLHTLAVVVVKPGNLSCHIRWSWISRPGRTYLVTAAHQPGGCSFQVLDATNPDALKAEVSLRRRSLETQMCIPMAQTRLEADVVRSGGPRSRDATDLPIPAAARGNATDSANDDLKALTR